MLGKAIPEPKKLFKNELETLEFLRTHKYIQENCPSLSADIEARYFYYKNRLSGKSKGVKGKQNGFNFESCFDIKIGKKAGKAYIGARIFVDEKGKYNDITYYLAICEQPDNNEKILKKIHFDYCDPQKSTRQPHPVFHYQVPGKISPRLAKDGYDCKHLQPELSEPRLPCSPMSLALLVNLALKEFPDENNIRLIEDSYWRATIRKNEELLLAPYYEKCNEFLKKRKEGVLKGGDDILFISEFCYGKDKH